MVHRISYMESKDLWQTLSKVFDMTEIQDIASGPIFAKSMEWKIMSS